MLHWVGNTHAGCAPGTIGGAPYVASKPCTVLGRRMRAAPRRPSVEIPAGPRSAVLAVGSACGLYHWDL
eukprot:494687-Pyramimonas_sp.AAC.1